MFDYKISKHPHFDEACRAFALRHNMAKLAERAGMNVQTLRNKLNPDQPHQLTAPEIWLLTDLTEDSTLVTARTKKGRIKRQMFAKLRTTKYLKTAASADSASVEFAGQVQRIARVHHYGLRDRVSRKGPEVRYEKRRLLGVNNEVETLTYACLYQWLTM